VLNSGVAGRDVKKLQKLTLEVKNFSTKIKKSFSNKAKGA